MKPKTDCNPWCFFAKNKIIRCAIAFYRQSPRLPIWCGLSNEQYAKIIRRAGFLSSERIRVNLTYHLRCNGTVYGYAFFAGIIILAASWAIYGGKILSINTFFLLTRTVFKHQWDSSTDMQHDLLVSRRDLKWPWPEVGFWPRLSKANMHIFRGVSTSGARLRPNYFASFHSSKVISEKKKHFCPLTFDDLWWP